MENGEASLKCLKSVKGTPFPSLSLPLPPNGGLGDTLAAFPTAQKERKKIIRKCWFSKNIIIEFQFREGEVEERKLFPFLWSFLKFSSRALLFESWELSVVVRHKYDIYLFGVKVVDGEMRGDLSGEGVLTRVWEEEGEKRCWRRKCM